MPKPGDILLPTRGMERRKIVEMSRTAEIAFLFELAVRLPNA